MSNTDLSGEASRDDEPRRHDAAAGPSAAESAGGDGTPDAEPLDGPLASPVGRLAVTVERLRNEVQAAHAAADGRALMDLAKGVLVERLHCGPAEAARQLSELAEQSAMTPLELAVDIINQAARDRLTEVAVDFATAVRDTPPTMSAAVRLRTAESSALAAEDTQAVAESLLQHALEPLGVTGVAIWAAGADGSLTLVGSSGFPEGEAERWRYVPPGVATVARTALTERRPEWIRSLAAGPPSIGRTHHPEGGRVAVPTGVGGRIHGVLEICWPTPLVAQPPAVVRQFEALAELCAHTLEIHSPSSLTLDGPPPRTVLSELTDLADSLCDPALVLIPQVDDTGHLTDFRVHHVNHRFRDPAGRPRSTVDGALLLEAYPLAADESGLFSHLERVYATGEPFRAGHMTLTALVDQVPLSSVAEVSMTRHGDSVLLIWRIEDEMARLANLLEHAQRLGRIGGFEENFVTGEITWNSQLFALYGRAESDGPAPVEDLRAHAHPDDAVAIGRFLRTVLHHRKPAVGGLPPAASGRGDSPHPRGRRTRRGHRRQPARRAWRVPGRLGPALDGGRTRGHPRPTRPLRTAVRGAQPTGPATATGHHALHGSTPGRAGTAHGRALSAYRDRSPRGRRLVRRRGPALEAHPAERRGRRRARHRGGHQHGRAPQRPARPGRHRSGPGPTAVLAEQRCPPPLRLGDGDRGLRAVRPLPPCPALGPRFYHLPPVLVRDGQATTLPLLKGLLLGAASDITYQEAEMRLEIGDTLLMYTDGLVERRDRSMEESLKHLLMTASAKKTTLDQRLDHLLTYSRSDTDDDTCIISIEVM